MYCLKCGAELPENSKFCNNCGAAISQGSTIEKREDASLNKDLEKWNNFGKDKTTYTSEGQPINQASEGKHSNAKVAITTTIIAIVAIAIIFLGVKACSGSSSVGTSTKTCPMCHRTYEVGDAAGNYRSIGLTGMCVNCYNNYKWAQDALGN